MSWSQITYEFPFPQIFHKELLWINTDCNVYFAFKLNDTDEWSFYAGNASHALETGQLLTDYGYSETSAQTNYLTTTKDSNGKVLAILPLNFQAKYARLYIQTGSNITVREWHPSTYFSAHEIITGELLITDQLSDAPSIRVVKSGVDRVKLGNISGYYGISGYDSSSNKIFELSDYQQMIGGWLFDSTKLYNETGLTLDSSLKAIYTDDFSSGPLGKGWRIGVEGAEFQNIAARGKLSCVVFEKDVVSSVGGKMLVSNSDILALDMSENDNSLLITNDAADFTNDEILQICDGENNEYLKIVEVFTGSVTQANLEASFIDGIAFVDFSDATKLSPYHNRHLTLTDSTGKSVYGWIKDVGTGETYDSELILNGTFNSDITSWDKYLASGSVWDAGGYSGGCAKVVADGGGYENCALYQRITTAPYARYRYIFRYKNAVGDIAQTYVYDATHSVFIIASQDLPDSESWSEEQVITFVVPPGCVSVQIGLGAKSPDTAYFDLVSIKKILTPSTTGATIVCAEDGEQTFNWISQDSGFNYNDTAGYTYSIRPGAMLPQLSTRLCFEAGFSTIDLNEAELLDPYIGQKITVTDSAGKQAVGYIGEAGFCPPELFVNGGFDNDITTGWIEYLSGTFEWDHGYLKITAGENYAGKYQDITVVPGRWYCLKFFYKNTVGDQCYYEVRDQIGNEYIIGSYYVALPSSTAWSDEQVVYFQAPVGCTTIRTYLCALTNTDVVWFDAVRLKQAVALPLPAAGFWYTADGSEYIQINPTTPAAHCFVGSRLYADFTGYGLYAWSGDIENPTTPWNYINISPTAMWGGAALFADYVTDLYVYDDAAWVLANVTTPTKIYVAGSRICGIYVDGIHCWAGPGVSDWFQLTANVPERIVSSGRYLYGDFGAGGIWRNNGGIFNDWSGPQDMLPSEDEFNSWYHIVSSPGSADRNWASVESGFNRRDIIGYTYEIGTGVSIHRIERDLAEYHSANNNPAWKKGTAVVSKSVVNGGHILLDASSTNSPVIQIFKRTGVLWNDIQELLRIGNLNGFLGYTTALYGLAVGDDVSYLTYDPTNGLIIKGLIDASEIDGSIITGSLIRTAETGRRIEISEDGLACITGAVTGKYGTFKYGDGTKYGAGIQFWINNPVFDVPLYELSAGTKASLHLTNRGSAPSGAAEVGDLVVISTMLNICQAAGSPSTAWYPMYPVRGTPSANKVIAWNSGSYAEWLSAFTAMGITASAAELNTLVGITVSAAELNALDGAAAGDTLYASAASTWAKLAKGAANLKKFMNAAGTFPEWASGIKRTTHTYDLSTASGTQTLSGVGFTPSMAIFIHAITTGGGLTFGHGFSDGTNHSCISAIAGGTVDGTYYTSCCMIPSPTAGAAQSATLAMNSDGGVLTWTKINSPTGTLGFGVIWFR